MATTKSRAPLVWIDCEMTGLSPSEDSILSVYCIVTDWKLNPLDTSIAGGFGTVIHHSASRLEAMGDWCRRTHSTTGLTDAALRSTTTAETAATQLLQYISSFLGPGEALLAGNSVHADKAFLAHQPWTPVLEYLHYRILDVSSIKEAARRWAPDEVLQRAPKKQGTHEAKRDIEESIEEARFYLGLMQQWR